MKMQKKYSDKYVLLALTVLFIGTLTSCNQSTLEIKSGKLQLSINDAFQTSLKSSQSQALALFEGHQGAETIKLGTRTITTFPITSISEKDSAGIKTYTVTGEYRDQNSSIEKTVTYRVYPDFDNLISTQVWYKNTSDHDEHLRSWSNNNYSIQTQNDEPSFWAFQGSSTTNRSDWVRPLNSPYFDKNYMGMNNSDYGGGIPITDVWRKDIGVAIGHLALKPKLVSLPTEIPLGQKNANISVTKDFPHPTIFASGETIKTLETFVMTHKGDYYNALSKYSLLMQEKGIKMPKTEEASFESIWCGWGYGRTFTANEIIGTLPKVKEMGIKWAVLDDGFQEAEGDWNADKKKYPRGNIEITELVDRIHKMDMKAKVWWTPLAVDPHSNVLKETPEMRLYQEDWSPQFITWWDAYYQAPVNPHTKKHTLETIDLFMNEYGFDGFKMDGQHMNAVLPDHNPASELDYPEQSVEGLPDYFQMIYDESRRIKPEAVIENCPCGTCMSYFNMASMNQAVASDPTSLWQVRHKGKTYKALIPQTAYYADQVEVVPFMGDYNAHFASAIGIGAVPGTKFTWPKDNPDNAQGEFLLTPEKEEIWVKWFQMYEATMLSKEEYFGSLYDIGYDKPETHLIKKGEDLYYAFYADEDYTGTLEFRGLENNTEYELTNYSTEEVLGTASTNSPRIETSFKYYQLVKASPKK